MPKKKGGTNNSLSGTSVSGYSVASDVGGPSGRAARVRTARPRRPAPDRFVSRRRASCARGLPMLPAMTLLEKRMLEKKAGNFLTDGDIRNIFNQFDRWSSQPLGHLLLASVFRGCPPSFSQHGRRCRDSNGYLGAHDLAIVYRSLGENLEDDLVICPARILCGCVGVWACGCP